MRGAPGQVTAIRRFVSTVWARADELSVDLLVIRRYDGCLDVGDLASSFFLLLLFAWCHEQGNLHHHGDETGLGRHPPHAWFVVMDAWNAERLLSATCFSVVGVDALLVSNCDLDTSLEVLPDERKEAHSLEFPAERKSLSYLRDANLLAGRHPPAMRGFSGRRGSCRRTEGGTKAGSHRRETIHMDQQEVPEMWKRFACATKSMRVRPCVLLDLLRRTAPSAASHAFEADQPSLVGTPSFQAQTSRNVTRMKRSRTGRLQFPQGGHRFG